MIRNSSPSIWISVPEYLPYNTVSPTLTVTGSSFLPGPAATTVPRCGFSFAVSGMIIPPAVFSSAGAGFTITLSERGVTFNFLPIVVSIFCFDEWDSPAGCRTAKVLEFHTKPPVKVNFTGLLGALPGNLTVSVNFSAGNRLFVRSLGNGRAGPAITGLLSLHDLAFIFI